MKFVHGLQLNEAFHAEAVGPLLRRAFPTLRYSCGLLGYGSDVLGYDNPTSMDHNWGPRLTIFVDGEQPDVIEEIDDAFRRELPPDFHGYPTNYSPKHEDRTQSMQRTDGPAIRHLIEIHNIDDYFRRLLRADVHNLNTHSWLRVPEQVLLELTAGKVFHDGTGKLTSYRETLAFYPLEVRKLRLAAYWDCIANEEAFVGRLVEIEDRIGVRLVAARLVTWAMKVCFLVRGRYSPYSKWFTRAFSDLGLSAISDAAFVVVNEPEGRAIESKLATLYCLVLELQNGSGEYPSVEATVSNFYQRPYRVINADRIVAALRESFRERESRLVDLSSVAVDGKVISLDFTNGDLLHRLFPIGK